MSKTTICIIALLLLLAGCDEKGLPPDAKGSIVYMAHRDCIMRVRLPNGEADSIMIPIGWGNASVVTALSDNKVLIVASFPGDTHKVSLEQSLRHDHIGVVSFDILQIRETNLAQKFSRVYISQADFDPVSGDMVVFGEADTVSGVMIFDSAWSFKEIVRRNQLDTEYFGPAFFIEKGQIAYSGTRGGTHISDRATRETRVISPKLCRGRNYRGSKLILYDPYHGRHYLHDLGSGRETALPSADRASDFVCSPDGRFVAYCTMTGFTDLRRLRIYDFQTRSDFKTDHVDVGSILWLAE